MEDQKTLQRQPQVATSDGLAACPNCEEMGDHQEIEHQMQGSRVACDCGVCGPWELDYDAAVAAWNHLTERCTNAANAEAVATASTGQRKHEQ